MSIISRVTTSYSAERIGIYQDGKHVVSAIHMFSLFDIHGNRISRAYVDFESMELDVKVGGGPTITYKL